MVHIKINNYVSKTRIIIQKKKEFLNFLLILPNIKQKSNKKN